MVYDVDHERNYADASKAHLHPLWKTTMMMIMQITMMIMMMLMMMMMMVGITKANDDDAEAHLCSFCIHIHHNCPQHLNKKNH